MGYTGFKSFTIAAFSLFLTFATLTAFAQQEEAPHGAATEHSAAEHETAEKEAFKPGDAILHHIADSHEFHFFNYKKSDGSEFHATLPLPVLVYSPQRGFSAF
ncbi:MAG TPA: hypothetical protein PKE30_14540, partial [Niabella sp.]|nr:hypothetical protein [Niabella sp.]